MYNKITKEPIVKVGIATFEKITFSLSNDAKIGNENVRKGNFSAFVQNDMIVLKNTDNETIVTTAKDKINLYQTDKENDFIEISDIEIGINFHWNRREKQRFNGDFVFERTGNKILIINIIALENYITSVISSEMNGNNPEELLKAHAVISRSWLMAQISGKKLDGKQVKNDNETIVWHDREDHDRFDVCADDHCQRYQGITRAYNPNVKKAIAETRGQMLTYNGEICDARFSKCCGGTSEVFETCWQPVHLDYLEKADDFSTDFTKDLTVEENANEFINSNPDAFCNTNDKELLQKILNDYDFESKNFYRWKVEFSQKELSELINRKSGEDFGEIKDLIPVERGTSARISKLKVVGTKQTKTIGKELEIRRLLSETHLYSSAFTVEKSGEKFILHGAGWGHGVGMCQIGGAVMASQGYKYDEILKHYYKKAEITKLY